jgi:hypothetical protein
MPSARGFGRATESKIGGEVDSAGKSLGKRLGTAMKVGAVGIIGAAAIGGAFIKGAIQNASDLNEANSKVGVVFGKQAAQIRKAAKTSATAMGLSKSAYLDATGTLGNLLVSLDIAPKKTAKMSKQMVKLAGDLASFNNVSPEDALDALKSGLTGETEPLKRFGVNMNDATLHAEALKLGLIKNIKDGLTPQAKALAAQSLIMSQTKTAQGDFARTSGGLANQQRILGAEIADVKAKLGTVFYPIATRVFHFLTSTGIPAIGNVGKAFRRLKGPLSNVGDFIGTAAGEVKDFFTAGAGAQPLKDALGFVKTTAGDIADAFGTAADKLGSMKDAAQGFDFGNIDSKKLGESLGTALIDGLKFLGKSAGKITGAIGSLMHKVDWVGVGIDIGKQAPALVIGLAAGILNFDVGSLFKGIMAHWFDILIGVLTIVFLPSKFLGPIEKILTKIPFVGRFLAVAVRWLNDLGGKLKSFGADLFRSFAKGFGAVRFPGAGIVGKVLGAFKTLPSKLFGFWRSIETRLGVWALDAFEAAGRGARAGVGKLLGFVGTIGGKALRALGDLSGLMFRKGVELIQGLINGILSKLADVGKAIGKVASKIKGFLPGSPVKEGPLRSWNNGAAGKRLVDLLALGLGDTSAVDSAMNRLSGRLATPRLTIDANVAANAASLSAGRAALTITNWAEGTGHIETIADSRVASAASFDGMAERAFS